jgi:DNA-binding NarL/FixJ family response regulator
MPASPARLLVVDDSELVRTQLRRAIEARSPAALLRVDVAASFAEAAALDPSAYARALLDLDLGDGDGATLGERYRARGGALALAFFTSETAATGGDTWRRARSLGACFSKPDDLARAVGWLLATDDDATVDEDA